MATIPRPPGHRKVDYPTSDGKPLAETEYHRKIMVDVIETLEHRFAADPRVHVSGDLMLFYEEGNRRKHVAPDIFVVFGVPKLPLRLYYLLWEEGKAPDAIIEVTSRTTRREDQQKKRLLYRDVLKVPEYYLFDPFEEYLKPSMQGFRLAAGEYETIAPVAGRLPSAVLGLHLERDGTQLRLFDPASGQRLPTQAERLQAAHAQAEAAHAQAEAAHAQAEAERLARHQAQAEAERLRRELEALRRRLGDPG
jgi:Uma2 family endonuclease